MKVPLAAAVWLAGRRGEFELGASVERGDLSSTAYASVLAAFGPDHRFTTAELCSLCLITSDNPIAEHLARVVTREAVERTASLLGCARTRMNAGFSDAELGVRGYANVTTARDAVAMLSTIVTEPRWRALAAALENSLRNTRIPLRLAPETRVPHKTGTLPGVVNDAGVVRGRRTDVAIAFLCEGQRDPPVTSLAIGDCVARIWRAIGEG